MTDRRGRSGEWQAASSRGSGPTLHPWDWYASRNRAAWEEIAEVRSRTYGPALVPPDRFADGYSCLDEAVVAAAGDVTGRRVLDLMCGTGETSLSWAARRATVTGVDFCDANVAFARQRGEASGLPVEFLAADVVDVLPLLADRFDIVALTGSVLLWIADLRRCFDVSSQLLIPGGILVLSDEHPAVGALFSDEGEVRALFSYFDPSPTSCRGWCHFAGGEDAEAPAWRFSWTLGQIVVAISAAALRITRFDELPAGPSWRFPDARQEQLQRLPGTMVIVAERDGP